MVVKYDLQVFYDNLYYDNIDRNRKIKAVVIPDDTNTRKLLSFMNKKQSLKKSFIALNLSLIKLLTNMKLLDLKTIKKLNLNPLKSAVKKADILAILKEFIDIHKKISYFISNMYLANQLFTNIPSVKSRKYKMIKDFDKRINCNNNKCSYNNKLKEINKNFAIEKFRIFHLNGMKGFKELELFSKSQLFEDYHRCIYSKCNKETITYFIANIIYKFTLFCIKNDCKFFSDYKEEFSKLKSSMRMIKIKGGSFEDFLIIISNYYKFLYKIKDN